MRIDKSTFEFEWDKGNIGKNNNHRVKDQEVEEIFFDDSKVILKDILHSKTEERFIILGKTKVDRVLYAVFTKRKNKIRIISARDLYPSYSGLQPEGTAKQIRGVYTE